MQNLLQRHSFLRERERLETSLVHYLKDAWPQIESGPLKLGWHIEAMCEHLEAFARGEFPIFLCSLPPRETKSTIFSVIYPTWRWTTSPWTKFMMLTYGEKLASTFSQASRRLIRSQWYQDRWGKKFYILEDQDTKLLYDNSAKGRRFSSTIGSGVLGQGADEIGIDDPHDTQATETDDVREKTLDVWDNTLTNRANDKKQFRAFITAQRLHEQDLIGHVLEKNPGAVYLRIPREFEEHHRCVTVVLPNTKPERWMDPRTVEGELMNPERCGPNEVNFLKSNNTPHEYAGREQQRPVPKSGGIFEADWFEHRFDLAKHPSFSAIIQSWDTASKDLQTSAYSVCTTWGIYGRSAYLMNVYRDRIRTDKLEVQARSLMNTWNADTVLIEEAASGIGLINALRHATTDWTGRQLEGGANIVGIKVPPRLTKEQRAENAAPFWSEGRGFIPSGVPWASDFITEHLKFPSTKFKDQVDSASQFVMWFTRRRLISGHSQPMVLPIYQR